MPRRRDYDDDDQDDPFGRSGGLYGYGDGYGPTRRVAGGIKAQTKRGQFGQQWWSKQWIESMERLDSGGRLQRGRSYARQGQVLSIDIVKGLVSARVQGSRPTPYAVTIVVQKLTDEQWKAVAERIAAEPIYAAKLLAGEMPEDIERIFGIADVSLFPASRKDIRPDCGCPDDANPCKHIAAVYYLLGEEFDRDPFLLFRLRGISRDEFVALLTGAIGTDDAEAAPEPEPQPLTPDPDSFWWGGPIPPYLAADTRLPPVSAALPRQLGGFPFWRVAEPLADLLNPAYRNAGDRGRALVYGDVLDRERFTE